MLAYALHTDPVEGVRNEVSGAVVGGVVQAHTVVVSEPTRPASVAGLPAQPVFVGRERELEGTGSPRCAAASRWRYA